MGSSLSSMRWFIDLILESQGLPVITTLSILFWTSWIIYRHIGDVKALKIAKQKYGASNVRRMGVLSEIWQIMYETNNSPIIHAFEYGPNSGYDLCSTFWESFSKKYVNWRSIPIKINGRWFWKEISIKDFKIEQHCKSIKIKSNGNTRKALMKFVNDHNMNKPFDPNKPLWECYYIHFDDVENEAYA